VFGFVPVEVEQSVSLELKFNESIKWPAGQNSFFKLTIVTSRWLVTDPEYQNANENLPSFFFLPHFGLPFD